MNNAFARRIFQFILCSYICIFPLLSKYSQAQTVLNKGDFAVVGINTNNGTVCGGAATMDLISFVCFKAIENGTVLDLTDNGWERSAPNLFGDTEGVLRATYTGTDPIPAGEVITFLTINVPETYESPSHPGVWNFQNISGSFPLNLNNGGDQIFFMQDGEWDPGTTNLHDATYSGRILFGFNSRSVWDADGSTQQSNLHPEVSDCFHMEPSSGQSDFLKYTGPMDAATQLEWISRISDANNWSAFPNCDAYNNTAPDYPAPVTLPLAPSGMFIECTVCSGCGTINDTLIFNLPDSGGPFTIEYTDGFVTFIIPGVENGDTAPYTTNVDSEVGYISVTDANGCPVFSNFEGGANITLEEGPQIDNPGDQVACSSFILPEFSGSNLSNNIAYYTASGGMGTQFAPNDEITTSTTLFIYDTFLNCEVEISFEITITNDIPDIDPIADISNCESIQLPDITGTNLSGNQAYYDAPNGTGNMFLPGDLVIESTTLFIFDGSPGCSDEESFLVEIFPLPELDTALPQNISCNGAADGSISIDVSGNGPFDFDWDVDALDGIEDPVGLNGGVYQVTITDANNCAIQASFNLTEPDALTLDCAELIPVSTIGGADGVAEIILNGGNVPYTISWTGPVTGMVESPIGGQISIPDLAAGIYDINVVDANMCEISCSFSITDPNCNLVVLADVNSPNCPQDESGSIELSLEGGTPPFTFDWNVDEFDGQEDLAMVLPGSYSVTVSDSESCNIVQTFSVEAASEIAIFTRVQAPICFGENSGFIILDSIIGGAPPYSFQINDEATESIPGLPFPIGDLTAGTYDLVISDQLGCFVESQINIASPPELLVELGPDQILEFDEVYQIQPVINFTPNTIVWNPESFLSNPDTLAPFSDPPQTITYNLLVQDSLGCSATDQITLTVDRNREVFIPNVFSPNDDGINDLFMIFGGKEIVEIPLLAIFDRWGGQIYENTTLTPNDESRGWDGTYRGEPLNTGVYTYFAEILFADGQIEILRGTIALIR